MTLYIYIYCISFDDPVHLRLLYSFGRLYTFTSTVFLWKTLYIYIDLFLWMTLYIYIYCISFDDHVHLRRLYIF